MTRFSRFSSSLLLVVALALPAGLPTLAAAQSEPALVTVRFNQPRVYFDQQLYGAIEKALAVKPEVMFDVVSFAPMTGNPDTDRKWQATASHNTRAVINAMKEMGVPMERISVTGTGQQGLSYDETQVFVR